MNDQLIRLPATLKDGKIQISQNEGRVILQTDFGLQVTYDEDWAVMVAVPSSYFGATCGLCGNFNEDAEDEMKLADGTQAASVEDWAESWRDPSCQDDCGGQGTLQDTEGCGELGWGVAKHFWGEKRGIYAWWWVPGNCCPSRQVDARRHQFGQHLQHWGRVVLVFSCQTTPKSVLSDFRCP